MIVAVAAAALLQSYVYPPYVPRSNVDRPGEVYDIGLCPDAADVSTDQNPKCPHVDTATVWVEDIMEDRARVSINGEVVFVPTSRVLINCRGTSTTLRTFWVEGRGYDFRSCD